MWHLPGLKVSRNLNYIVQGRILTRRPSGIPESEAHALIKTESDAAGKEADKRAKVEKAKSKGRFQIIESDDKARGPKPQVIHTYPSLTRLAIITLNSEVLPWLPR